MKIEWVEKVGKEEMWERMRQVTLQGTGEKIYCQKRVSMSIRGFPLEYFHPVQRYVLKQDLERVSLLRHSLKEQFDIDILFLNDGFVRMKLEGEDSPIDVLPPVVESHGLGGKKVRLVVDGLHRLYVSYLEWVNLPYVILIENVDTPYYGYPIPGSSSWEKVEIRSDLPEGYLKRWPRCPDHKKLFRQFDSPGAFNTQHTSRGVVQAPHPLTKKITYDILS